MRNGELIPKHLAPPLNVRFGEGPMVISDCMDSLVNMADGQRYDSKRAYEKAVRRAGCEIVGNESVKAPPRPQMDDPVNDIKQAFDMVQARTPKKRAKKRKG